MKTIRFFLLISILTLITSCNKEPLNEPIFEEQTQDEQVKFQGKLNSGRLQIKLENKRMPFRPASKNGTVKFKGQLWSVANSPDIFHDPTDEAIIEAQVWSSRNGKHWTLRARDPFQATTRHSLVVFGNKMWKIGGFAIDSDGDTALQATYYTTDGINWHYASTSNLPHLYVDQAVVFNNKIFVFGGLFEPYSDSSADPVIYSSRNGMNWTLEASDVLDTNRSSAIVFKNYLYLMHAFEPNSYTPDEMWRSADGRNWSKVSQHIQGPFVSINAGIPSGPGSAKVVYNNKVWLIGGSTNGGATRLNDIWYSKDMRTWTQYQGDSKFNPVWGSTALNFRGKILLFGGSDNTSYFKEIWSIKEKNKPYWY